MATLTAQGVPTSVAANSVKAGLAELGKAGSVADKSFQKVAGKTFPEFIASGGDLAGALDILNKAAKEGDTSVTNLFGSVEAGQAFSALATNVDSFESNLEEMRGSAGATQEAFDRMDQGLGKTFDKLKARAEVGFVKVGEKIAPFVDKAIEKFDELVSKIDFSKIREKIKPVEDAFKRFFDALGSDEDINLLERIAIAVADMFNLDVGELEPVFKFIEGIADDFSKLYDEVKANDELLNDFKLILKGLAVVVGVVILGALKIFVNNLRLIIFVVRTVRTVVVTVFKVLSKVFEAGKRLFSAVVAVWKGDSSKMEELFSDVWQFVVKIFTRIKNWAKENLPKLLKSAGKKLIEGLKKAISKAIPAVLSAVKSIPGRILTALGGIGSLLINTGKKVINGLISGIRAMSTALGVWIWSIRTKITTAIGDLRTLLVQKGKDIISGLISGIVSKFDELKRRAQEIADTVSKIFTSRLKIFSPSKVFEGYGRNIIDGLNKGLAKSKSSVGLVGQLADDIANTGFSAPPVSGVGLGGVPQGQVVYQFGDVHFHEVQDAEQMFNEFQRFIKVRGRQ